MSWHARQSACVRPSEEPSKRECGRRCRMDSITPPTLLLTPKQAAKALAISERTLWELARRGEIKRLKINSCVRYDVRDLESFIATKKGDVQ